MSNIESILISVIKGLIQSCGVTQAELNIELESITKKLKEGALIPDGMYNRALEDYKRLKEIRDKLPNKR